MIDTTESRYENAIDSYLPYLLEVLQHRNPRGFDRDVASRIRPTPDISESAEGEYFISNLEFFCHPYAILQ